MRSLTRRLSNSPAFLLPRGLGNVRNPYFVPRGFGEQNYFTRVFHYFRNFVCVNEKQKGMQKFKIKVKLINGIAKLIQQKGFSKYFLNLKMNIIR